MKLLTKRLFIIMLVIALAVIAITLWGVATTSGSRWLLSSVAPLGGIRVSAQKIEGRISDHLTLTGVRVRLAQQQVEIDSLVLRWQPLQLLVGRIAVEELTINGVRIQDDAPAENQPLQLRWPQVSGNLQHFAGRIAQLRVSNLSYRRLQEEAVQVTSIVSAITWKNAILSMTDLLVVAPSGQIRGGLSAGFKQPALTADLVIGLIHPLAEMDHFSVQIRQSQSTGTEPFVGIIALTGSTGTRKTLEMCGELGMAKNAINLRRLRLTHPGREGLLTAEGSLAFTVPEPLLTLQIGVIGLDLTPELKFPTNLTGTMTFAGTLEEYQGNFTLTNQKPGWQGATFSSSYQGSRSGIKLAPLTAAILDGSLAGDLAIDWRDGLALQGAITGRNLNPAKLDPAWKGVANFTASVDLTRVGTGPFFGNVSAALSESFLHGQALTGELQANLADDHLSIKKLALQGKGFDLHASGDLQQKLTLGASISDFSRLIPGAAGELKADGWVRWDDGQISGVLNGTGSKLAYNGTRIAAAHLSARQESGTDSPWHLSATLRHLAYAGYALDAATLNADGTLLQHSVNASLRLAGNQLQLGLVAGYSDATWSGELSHLDGKDNSGAWTLAAPATFALSAEKFFLSPLLLTSGGAEHLEIAADLTLNPFTGGIKAHWQQLNLARANPYLSDAQITGRSQGTIQFSLLTGNRLTVAGSATGSGTFTAQGQRLTLSQSQVTFTGKEDGLHASIELTTLAGGKIKGTFSSSAPLSMAIPEQGDLNAEWNNIDLAQLKPWLPPETDVAGRLSGQTQGRLLPGQRLELDGHAALAGGTFQQKRPEGELKLAFKEAKVAWGWRGEALSGDLSLTMAEYGAIQAKFQLPLAARFPLAMNPQGPLQGDFVGKFEEKGITAALFPGFIRESFGTLDAEMKISGTWEVPQFTGKVSLAKAGAYLPTAGIHLQDVQLVAHLEKNLIRIDSFRAVSGPGQIEGRALINLSGWQVTEYQGALSGENFQTIYFPELKILSSPKLSFTGTPKKLTLRGELRLPEVYFIGEQSHTVIKPSSDVIVEGRIEPSAKSSPLALDIQVRLLLGKKVFVTIAGIDAQLGGAVELSFNSLDNITSTGEIEVVKGRYRTYGVNLEIVRGRLFFAGGPVDQPTLDFLALRTVGEVRAGVTVTGTLQKPLTKLYSEPAMPDTDILAYIVLGHPLNSDGEQGDLVARAAGALLGTGQAEVVQNQLKNRLGLSTLEIQGGVGGQGDRPMGYKPMQGALTGAGAAGVQPGITETMLTVGKYLTPKLYISYGRSLFTGSNLFRLRYDIYKKWQIETQTGNESGVDLFYKLEYK